MEWEEGVAATCSDTVDSDSLVRISGINKESDLRLVLLAIGYTRLVPVGKCTVLVRYHTLPQSAGRCSNLQHSTGS